MQNHTIRIGLIGLGPRGLSVLERLCANATVYLPAGASMLIHVIDPYVGDGSHVWRGDQDPILLMNTVASQISMFVDDSVDCLGPVVPGPSLYEWARSLPPGAAADPVGHEAARLGPDSYPSRSFYGRYLTWVLDHIMRNAPPVVDITLHADLATDLWDITDGTQQIKLAGGTTTCGLDAVVLAQGHLMTRPTTGEAAATQFAGIHGLRYIRPGNPADVALDHISPGEITLLRGMGLNFFDHMALLTIGRGGSFFRLADGKLVYRRSGREPQLVAGSRRGVPHKARGENQKGPSGRHQPIFLTPDVIGTMQNRARSGQPVDFRTDLWPLIDREVRAVYYSTLIGGRGTAADARAFLSCFVNADHTPDQVPSGRDDSDQYICAASAAERVLLDSWGVTAEELWDWHRIAHPYIGLGLRTTPQFRHWLRLYLDDDVQEAKMGNVHGALKAAFDVLRDLRNEIRLVVDHGGLSGDSYRDDLQKWYMPLNAYLSIGPPTVRTEQLGALIDAGVVTIMGPELMVRQNSDIGRFVASSTTLPDELVEATTFIEARLPETDLRQTTDELVRNLLTRGACRSFEIPIAGGGSYRTGGLAVTQRPYRMVGADGRAHARRFAFGVPTETVHWITAAGIRPGVNSVTLTDADAVARAGIAAALDRTAVPAMSSS